MRRQHRQGEEVVLCVGAEGGDISIVRRLSPSGRWLYLAYTDESTLWDMIDEPEGSQAPADRRQSVHQREAGVASDANASASFEDAIRSIGRYPWPRLTPVEIHPEYRERVLEAARWHPEASAEALAAWERWLERIDQRRTQSRNLSPFEEALRIAAVVHAHQVRKGTLLPYVSHVVAVSHLLEQAGQPEAVVLAGLLHDVLEDVNDDGRTRAALEATFEGFEAAPGTEGLREALAGLIDRLVGPEVRWLVQGVSETKEEGGQKRPWKTRKVEQLQHLAEADARLLALKAADALHNVQAILHDSRTTAGRVFSRFNASVDDLLWSYGTAAAVISERLGDDAGLARDLQVAVRALAREVDGALGERDAFTGRRPKDDTGRDDTIVAVVSPGGDRIHSVAEWRRLAPPARGAHQWRAGRSAMESARSWFTDGTPEPVVPQGIRALLDSHDATRGAVIRNVFPEHETRLDRLGRGRQHDVLACGLVGSRPLVLAIEAKADESFGEVIADVLSKADAVNTRAAARQGPPTRRHERVEQLAQLVFGRGIDEALGALRYQLLHAVAGTLLEAQERGVSLACFVVQEFTGPATNDTVVERNARELSAFVRALGLDAPDSMPTGTLLGPLAFALPGGAQVDLLIGKVTTPVGE